MDSSPARHFSSSHWLGKHSCFCFFSPLFPSLHVLSLSSRVLCLSACQSLYTVSTSWFPDLVLWKRRSQVAEELSFNQQGHRSRRIFVMLH